MYARITVAALALAALAACSSGGSTDQTTRDFLAYDACQDAVSQQLKAPGSADFQSSFDAGYANDGSTVTVTGWVDAQNSYGAKLRSTWTCTAEVDDQGNTSNVQATLNG